MFVVVTVAAGPVASASTGVEEPQPPDWLWVVAGAFVVGGALFDWANRRARAKARGIEHLWMKVPATITVSRVASSDPGEFLRAITQARHRKTFEVETMVDTDTYARLEYTYSLGGETYTSRSFTSGRGFNKTSARALIESHPVGSQIQVWVNPMVPGEAVFAADGSLRTMYTAVWGPWFFYAGGVLAALAALGVIGEVATP